MHDDEPTPLRQDRYGFIDWRMLPTPGWDQFWDRIYVPEETKRRLYNYAKFSLTRRGTLSLVGLPLHGIGLLRGEPGTGKSSLVKGVANLLSREFDDGLLFADVDAHALPSQMLGDSQRNTATLLERALPELVDKGFPVVALIDEVDAFATDRDRASSGTDPVDVARATEAALQGLDHLADANPDMVILATSNFPQAIDPAFLSRLDLMIDLDMPPAATVEAILRDALSEVGSLLDDAALKRTAGELVGLSGRDVRKVVVEAVITRDTAVSIDAPLEEKDLMAAIAAKRHYGGPHT